MTEANDYGAGWRDYRCTAAEVAGTAGINRHVALLRILATKALYGLSAREYALFGLYRTPFGRLREYRTKKQTTASIGRVNPAEFKPLVEDKLRFHRVCQAVGLPTPRLHAVLSSGTPREADGFVVLPDFAALCAHFRDHSLIRLILKPRSDALGTGVRFVALRHGEAFDIEDRPIPVPAFADALHFDMRRDDYLVQGFVPPHPHIARLGTGRALATLRVVTLVADGDETLAYALLRIPAGGNVHDNFSGGTSGNLIAAVDLASGRIGAAWGRRDPHLRRVLERFDRNPDTGVPIRGETVPGWAQVRALAGRAARAFPQLPLLGWDLAPSADGLVVIEANSNPDIIGAQVCCGQGARALLEPLWRA